MPSLFPFYDFHLPVPNTSDSFADPNTGSLSVRAGEGSSLTTSSAEVGDSFTIPGDVVALSAFATIEVQFDCSAWGAIFGGSSARVDASVSLFNNRSDAGRILVFPHTTIAWANAWIGTWGPGIGSGVYSLEAYADWGEPLGVPSTWSTDVQLVAMTSVSGWAGAHARASTVVRRIDYEMWWPA
jgi:hypothetical protein